MPQTVPQSTVDEIKDLLDSGDVSIDEMRGHLQTDEQKKATDEQLIVAYAALSDEDYDEFRTNVDNVLKGELVVG